MISKGALGRSWVRWGEVVRQLSRGQALDILAFVDAFSLTQNELSK